MDEMAFYAFLLAKNAFRQGWNLTKDVDKEFLLYYYNTRNLSKALERAEKEGIKKRRKGRLSPRLLKRWKEVEERVLLPFR